MCDHCDCRFPKELSFILKDKNGVKCYCPNCCVTMLMNGELALEDDPERADQITGEMGAVFFRDYEETVSLNRMTMLRYLNHSLVKKEYKRLISIGGYTVKGRQYNVPYMLHDDFYGDDGTAYQPYISNEMLNDIYNKEGVRENAKN